MVGTNPVISKQCLSINPGQTVKQAVKNVMKLIVVDPRKIESAKHAVLHIQPQPGQDSTLLAGFLHVIFAEELYDAYFVTANAVGFDVLKRAVDGFTPDHVSRVVVVPKNRILLAARTFAAAKCGCVVTAPGYPFPLPGPLI